MDVSAGTGLTHPTLATLCRLGESADSHYCSRYGRGGPHAMKPPSRHSWTVLRSWNEPVALVSDARSSACMLHQPSSHGEAKGCRSSPGCAALPMIVNGPASAARRKRVRHSRESGNPCWLNRKWTLAFARMTALRSAVSARSALAKPAQFCGRRYGKPQEATSTLDNCPLLLNYQHS